MNDDYYDFLAYDPFSTEDIAAFANMGYGYGDELNPYVGTPVTVGGTGSSYETGAGLPGEEAAAGSQGGAGGTGNVLPAKTLTQLIQDAAKQFGLANDKGTINPIALLGLTSILASLGQGQKKAPVVGYTGGVPKYTAVRERVAVPEDPNRRPGAGGRRYFSDVTYAKDSELPTAREAAKTQAVALKPALYPAPAPVSAPAPAPAPAPVLAPAPASGVAQLMPVPKYDEKGNVVKAEGGLLNLARGRYLNGSSDGMEDKIPATIADKQPARLSHGEFVIPADVVSHLGNGNSNAGAQRLYDMMDRIRKARTGNPKQGKQINPNKYLPK